MNLSYLTVLGLAGFPEPDENSSLDSLCLEVLSSIKKHVTINSKNFNKNQGICDAMFWCLDHEIIKHFSKTGNKKGIELLKSIDRIKKYNVIKIENTLEDTYLSCKAYLPIVERFRVLCREWPKYSGKAFYPVPSPTIAHSPSTIFLSSDGDMWEGEYGKLRRELLDFAISELEK